jgi:prepilin-type N-terminal cleavage/methylation domain-containing protein
VNAPRFRQAGFTLLEMLVVMVLLAVVLGALFGTLNRTRGEADRVGSLVEKRQSARAAVQLLERDVRMSGSGWGRSPVIVSYNGAPDTFYAITPGPVGGPNSSDSLTIMGAWAASTTIEDAMPNPSSTLKVDDTSGFSDGDLVVITDGTSANMFEVTGVNSSSGTLQHNPASPYNPPGGFSQWPSGGYGVGAQVFKIDILSYRVDSTSYKRPALVRRPFRGAQSVVAYDVDKFQVWYHMQDGTETRSPGIGAASAATIDKVRPVITLRLKDRTRPTYSDSVWAEVQPRAF